MTRTVLAGDAVAVQLDSVYKAFVPRGRASHPLLALEDVSFTVAEGEFIGLLGPSGCGKSTVLNLLAGLSKPSSGTVVHEGRPVRGINTAIGYITQDDNLLPWRSTLSNVEFGMELRGMGKAERRERAREFIHLVGLDGFEPTTRTSFPAACASGPVSCGRSRTRAGLC